ncbi:MAG: N-formylglutamate amidohydrolase [Rhodospirillaceae bacterium]|nr:N-formylglutamate amidohydrolase [Rhodospirillaceae bacterium]
MTGFTASGKPGAIMDISCPPPPIEAPAQDDSPNGAWPRSPAFDVLEPAHRTAPVIFASPHSGADYPAEFVAASRLDPLALRKSEDSFVDELFAAAPAMGAPLLRARFPRAFLDANREPFELDPRMFADPLPAYVNTRSPRVAAGLGTIARVVSSGADIYCRKLRFDEALHRVNACYRPYHTALAGLIESTLAQFGVCLLIDCHSMPSVGGPADADSGRRRVDIVLGDCHGTSCDRQLTELARRTLARRGYVVRRNVPYAGAYTTRHYGAPQRGVHALQIEINRALYMDEASFRKTAGFGGLAANLAALIEEFTRSPMAAAA